MIDPSTISADWVEALPLASLKKGQPISFDIPASNDLFIHPEIYIKVTFKITNADGSGIGQDIPIAPINNSLHSLWQHVEAHINGRNVSVSSGNYTYNAYFRNQYECESTNKEGTMEAEIFYEDTPGEFDSVDPASNLGFSHRKD